MWKMILAASAVAVAFSSCATRTAHVTAMGLDDSMLTVRLPDRNPGGIPPQEQMLAVNAIMAEGLTPEEQGRKYFPGLRGKEAPTVKIEGMYGRTLLRDGSTIATFTPVATVRAKTSAAHLQEVVKRLEVDLRERGQKQGKVISFDQIGFKSGS